jgi:hypothetical protein
MYYISEFVTPTCHTYVMLSRASKNAVSGKFPLKAAFLFLKRLPGGVEVGSEPGTDVMIF